jgi:peptidase E
MLPMIFHTKHHQGFKKTVEKTVAKYESELKLYPISNSQAILVNGANVMVVNK